MINKVRLATIFVNDQDAAYDFWVNKVGFEVQSDVTMADGYRWLEVRPSGAETAVAVAKAYPDQETAVGVFTNIIFTTTDIDKTYQTLLKNGVHFKEKPALQPWGNKQAQFADSDGNLFLLVDRQ